MFARILQGIGAIACLSLIISCFLPWAYLADNNIPLEAERTFTGFFSYQNYYGKPGILLVPLALVVMIFMFTPKLWAKRINLFASALIVAFAISKYTQFSSCYNAYCPEKKGGIFLMLFSSFVILIVSIFPRVKVDEKK